MKRKLFCGVVLLVLLALPVCALAQSTADAAGNVFFADSLLEDAPLDVYGTGEALQMQGVQVGESALIVGRDLTVSNCKVGGSVRAAGYDIRLSGTDVGVNATLAGYTVTVDPDVAVKGAYLAGYDVTFSGVCNALNAAGATVTLNGVVNGDATIYADKVILGENVAVAGTLKVSAAEAPTMPAGANIPNLQFTPVTTETTQSEDAAPAAQENPVLRTVKSFVKALFGRLVLAVLYYFLLGSTVKKAGRMMSERPVAMPLTGLLGILAAPLALLLLLITVIGVPAAVLLALLLSAVLGFAFSFAGCALGTRVFPKMHALLASCIGVAVFSVLYYVPVLGGLLVFASMCYTLGYFLQTLYQGWRKAPAAPAGAAEANAEAVAEATQLPEATEAPEAPEAKE